MLANYLIGLREGLEAALVVGILVAYLVKSGRRDALGALWTGVAVAVGLSLLAGAVLTFGPSTMSEQAEEIVGGVLSLLAVALVTWMVLWMARTARHLATDLHGRLDGALALGSGAVATVALLAVGREGLETALFLWAGVSAAGSGAGPLVAAALGLATAVVIGWAVYRGAVRLNLRTFFSWTGLALVVVAAGVLAYGVHELVEAGVLPGLGTAWDIRATFPADSWYATLLRGTVGFRPEVTWLEVLAWAAYLGTVGTIYVRQVWPRRRALDPVEEPAAAHA